MKKDHIKHVTFPEIGLIEAPSWSQVWRRELAGEQLVVPGACLGHAWKNYKETTSMWVYHLQRAVKVGCCISWAAGEGGAVGKPIPGIINWF